MKTKRYFLPAGSAVAAAVILIVLLATPTQRSVVSASTIMASLREAQHQGLRVTIEDLQAEGFTINGTATVLFDQPFSLSQMVAEHGEWAAEPHGVYFDAAVVAGPDVEDIAGLDLQVAGGMATDEQWVYARFNNIDPLIELAGPVAVLYGPMLKAGILLELDGLFEEGGPFVQAHHAALHDAVADAHPGLNEHTAQAHVQLSFDANDPNVILTTGVQINTPTEFLGDAELRQTLKRFLTGEAAPSEFQKLIAAHEELEGRASVEEVEPGLHVLTIRDFDEVVGDEGDAILANTHAEIAYREGSGIEWARLVNVGELHGSLRLEFVDDASAASKLTKAQYIQEGVTTVLNVKDLMNNAQSLMKAFNVQAEP